MFLHIITKDDLVSKLKALPEEEWQPLLSTMNRTRFLQRIISNGWDLGYILRQFPEEQWRPLLAALGGTYLLSITRTVQHNLLPALVALPEEQRSLLLLILAAQEQHFLEQIIVRYRDLLFLLAALPEQLRETLLYLYEKTIFLQRIMPSRDDLPEILREIPVQMRQPLLHTLTKVNFLQCAINSVHQLRNVLILLPNEQCMLLLDRLGGVNFLQRIIQNGWHLKDALEGLQPRVQRSLLQTLTEENCLHRIIEARNDYNALIAVLSQLPIEMRGLAVTLMGGVAFLQSKIGLGRIWAEVLILFRPLEKAELLRAMDDAYLSFIIKKETDANELLLEVGTFFPPDKHEQKIRIDQIKDNKFKKSVVKGRVKRLTAFWANKWQDREPPAPGAGSAQYSSGSSR